MWILLFITLSNPNGVEIAHFKTTHECMNEVRAYMSDPYNPPDEVFACRYQKK